MSDEFLCAARRLSSCRRRRLMKLNSPRREGVDELWRKILRRVGRKSLLSSVNSSLITHHSSLRLEVAAHGVEPGLNRLDGGREGEAQVPLAVLAEDDAGDCGDLRAFEKEVGGGAAVRVDVGHVGEGVERAVRRFAREAEFAEAGDEQVAALAVGAADVSVEVRGQFEGRERGPL